MKITLLRLFSANLRLGLLGLLLAAGSNDLFAEGSKDLYPADATGNRAFLVSRPTGQGNASWPFPTFGAHYVYVKAGETLHTASSAQNVEAGKIRLTAPDGTIYTSSKNNIGKISSRAQELAGPSATGSEAGDNYSTFNRTATATQEGIWKVEFIAPGGETNSSDTGQVNIAATGNWAQATATNSAVIAAWDISVRNSTGWVKGRVYANVLNLLLSATFTEPASFFATNYVLTKDGYTYRVKANGSNGVGFTSFVNNRGFVDTSNNSIYKSLDKSDAVSVANATQDPRVADGTKGITHKIFYNIPDAVLPASSIGSVPGGTTWLKTARVEPNVTSPTIRGVEGTDGQIGSKGGYLGFTADLAGKYEILIESSTVTPAFTARTLTGNARQGDNSIYWDGKDGKGNPIPSGDVPIKVSVTLQGGEVHFPYIDMEVNPKGIIIQLYKADLSGIESSTVYWDDSNIKGGLPSEKSDPISMLTGADSTTGAHKWGTYTASSGSGNSGYGLQSFGNEKSMDTWTFVKGATKTRETSVTVKIADLAVTSLTADKTQVKAGESVVFTVKVKNTGPNAADGAKFTFKLPVGLTAGTAIFTGTCGTQETAINYDPATRTYTSVLNLPNGCEITYTINAVGSESAASANITVEAAILRPNDVTDPDATNIDPNAPLIDAESECANNGPVYNGVCNNIKTLALLAVCDISSRAVDASDNSIAVYNLPPTDIGYQFDIRQLDNSFTMLINNSLISNAEIQFETNSVVSLVRNIEFSDGTQYGGAQVGNIWTITGTDANPALRVVISSTGAVSMFGSKTSGGPLFPLKLKTGTSFNNVPVNTDSPNTLKITQSIQGATYIRGRIYGAKTAPCVCADPANKTGTADDTKVGITLLQRAGATANNWPMVRKGGHLALESNTKGFVPTRLTTAQVNALPNPQEGMMVFDTGANCLKIHDGTSWKCFSNAGCL